MSMHEHKKASPTVVKVFIVTVSDTRTVEDDKSGKKLRELLEAGGHEIVGHEIVKDELQHIQALLQREAAHGQTEAIILTGGTGITPRDVTFEAVRALLDKEIPGYGELFRMLSYHDIGPAAMLSRAIAGVMQGKIVIATPGSTAAVTLAVEKLILPELGHLLREARRR